MKKLSISDGTAFVSKYAANHFLEQGDEFI